MTNLGPLVGLRIICFNIMTVRGAIIATNGIELVTKNTHPNCITR